jgi:hypothetical protein
MLQGSNLGQSDRNSGIIIQSSCAWMLGWLPELGHGVHSASGLWNNRIYVHSMNTVQS